MRTICLDSPYSKKYYIGEKVTNDMIEKVEKQLGYKLPQSYIEFMMLHNGGLVNMNACPSAGHDMIFLDYRDCGPEGEPAVVHVDEEYDYEITRLADNFEEFVNKLVTEKSYSDNGKF